MQKRWLALMLAVALAAGVCGCVKKTAEVLPSPGVDPAQRSKLTETAEQTPAVTQTAAPAVESSAEAALFLSFLNGEVQATVGDDFCPDLNQIGYSALADNSAFDDGPGMELSISSLWELVEGSFDKEYVRCDVQMDYAILETMGGREMLVVRSISSLGVEEFKAYFIFGAYEGQLRLTYAEDSWSRSWTELHEGLIFSGNGSNGAADNLRWRGYIDEDGHYKSVYEAEFLGFARVAMDAYGELGVENMDWTIGCECCFLTTEEGKFYDLDGIEGLDPEKVALLRKYYEEQGMTEVDDAEAVMSAAEAVHSIQNTPVITDWIALQPGK